MEGEKDGGREGDCVGWELSITQVLLLRSCLCDVFVVSHNCHLARFRLIVGAFIDSDNLLILCLCHLSLSKKNRIKHLPKMQN